MPFHIGAPEAIVIVTVLLLIFGVGKLPDAMAALGKGFRSFKRGVEGKDEDEAKEAKEANA